MLCVSHLITQVTCFVGNVSLDCQFTFHISNVFPPYAEIRKLGCNTRMQIGMNYMEVESHSEFAT